MIPQPKRGRCRRNPSLCLVSSQESLTALEHFFFQQPKKFCAAKLLIWSWLEKLMGAIGQSPLSGMACWLYSAPRSSLAEFWLEDQYFHVHFQTWENCTSKPACLRWFYLAESGRARGVHCQKWKQSTCWPSKSMPTWSLSPGNPMLQVPISWVMIYESLLEQCCFQKRRHVLFNQLSLSLQAMMHSWIVRMWILWELQHVQKNGCGVDPLRLGAQNPSANWTFSNCFLSAKLQ